MDQQDSNKNDFNVRAFIKDILIYSSGMIIYLVFGGLQNLTSKSLLSSSIKHPFIGHEIVLIVQQLS